MYVTFLLGSPRAETTLPATSVDLSKMRRNSEDHMFENDIPTKYIVVQASLVTLEYIFVTCFFNSYFAKNVPTVLYHHNDDVQEIL
jgi:hypothetical protein